MAQQKLYTEEQVKNVLKERTFLIRKSIDVMFDTLTPIELPSDKDIDRKSEVLYPINKGDPMRLPSRYDIDKANRREGFLEGAKWMRKQILKQTK